MFAKFDEKIRNIIRFLLEIEIIIEILKIIF